ncbi:MAG: histidinol-phosphatase [Clostridia bacterium]|nr:histidinol-phosphatase [Clostridia bacterium]
MVYRSPQKSNLHTHTDFCDGANAPEEIVKEAIRLGMEAIGFSGHSYTPIDTSYCMTREGTEQYRAEIERLKQVYGDRIKTLCGIELDYYGEIPNVYYDYIIGSVHYVRLDGEYCVVDKNAQSILDAVQQHCKGDIFRYTREYYRAVAEIADQTQCDIVGHFDLVTKFNEGGQMFDESDPRYLKPAFEAIDALLTKDVIFEVNTGAISRGYRKTPYPAVRFLRYLRERGGYVTISADAHCKEHLLHSFDETANLLMICGFRSVLTMTKQGWKEVPILE